VRDSVADRAGAPGDVDEPGGAGAQPRPIQPRPTRAGSLEVGGITGDDVLAGGLIAGRYQLVRVIGEGAMAVVHQAIDLRLDREVAVKVFRPGIDPSVRSRFGAEARALARLSHPGLVSIFDAGVDGDRPYLVMRLVDGECLRYRLGNGPLTPHEVCLLGADLAGALADVHASGVVHRDIKPSNIVLDKTGRPHLTDFGIALLLDAARITGSNEILGTAAYLAPEQILGTTVGAESDIYSLGLVLLECVTGQVEYPGASKVESALSRLHRAPRVPADLPPALAGILLAMTASKPADRPTAADCVARFSAALAAPDRVRSGRFGKALPALAFVRPRPCVRSGRSHDARRPFVVAAFGVLLALGAAVWLVNSLGPAVGRMPVAGARDDVPVSSSAPHVEVAPPAPHAEPVAATSIDLAVEPVGARAPRPIRVSTVVTVIQLAPATTVVLTAAPSVPDPTVTVTPQLMFTPQSSEITPPPVPPHHHRHKGGDHGQNGPQSTTASTPATTTTTATGDQTP
jgi:tRNA A-37 threonylcarbamoyl transferase component Bud32